MACLYDGHTRFPEWVSSVVPSSNQQRPVLAFKQFDDLADNMLFDSIRLNQNNSFFYHMVNNCTSFSSLSIPHNS